MMPFIQKVFKQEFYEPGNGADENFLQTIHIYFNNAQR